MAERYISQTIDSVCRQTHENLEVIVVNDGSDDNTQTIVEEMAQLDARIIPIYQSNAGVSAARNNGISRAHGNYIALLDADDLMEPTSIQERLEKLNSGNYALVHSDMVIIDDQSLPTGKINSGLEGWVLDDLLAWKGTVIPTPSSVLFKKSVVDDIGGFNIHLSNNADQEFFYRLAAKYEIGRVPKPLGMYRVHLLQMHKNIPLMYKDTLLAYSLAKKNNLFKTKSFQKRCYSRMYFILANCFLKDARKPLKAIILYIRAFFVHPANFLHYLPYILIRSRKY